MKRTHLNSKIVQFHHTSPYGKKLLSTTGEGTKEIVLQIESVQHNKYDFIAEVIDRETIEEENKLKKENAELKETIKSMQDQLTYYRHESENYDSLYSLVDQLLLDVTNHWQEGMGSEELDQMVEDLRKFMSKNL